MHQRGRDAVADHPLPRDPDERDRVVAAAGQPGPGPADRAAQPAVQRADHRRPLEGPARAGAAPRPPRRRARRAARRCPCSLRWVITSENRSNCDSAFWKLHPQHPEPALLLGRRRRGARTAQPAEERLRPAGAPRAGRRSGTARSPTARPGRAPPPRRWVSWSTNGRTDASLVSSARVSCSRSHVADGRGTSSDSDVQQDDLAAPPTQRPPWPSPASGRVLPTGTARRTRRRRTRPCRTGTSPVFAFDV